MREDDRQDLAIRIEDVVCRRRPDEAPVINGMSLAVPKGQWLCVTGGNGSGKSTLVRLINGLLAAEQGTITVGGCLLRAETLWEVRKQVGVVFASPDDQFVGLTVADDLAFGLENRCLPQEEMQERISRVAAQLGIASLLDRHPGTLSGGQKQRAALAAVLAMEPDILILDEAMSMLDAASRRELLDWLTQLRATGQYTMISVTHDIEEMAAADRMIMMQDGQIAADGRPDELLRDEELLRSHRIEIPFVVALCNELKQRGLDIGEWTTEQEAVHAIWALYSTRYPTATRMDLAL
ncbi:ATP-binding cassette domain-containing protein [Paenibacillus sp. 1P07SE]|uniref:ATP-binding cassette domain-containing protein n=1 Tax=Paenibacillus sp. 1P07SE TaxID=3132209 RepID=UPI0039A62E08